MAMSGEGTATPAAGDPSMEEILSSIRRILSEEEPAAPPPPAKDDVLVLDPSMMVGEEPSPRTAEAGEGQTAAPEPGEPKEEEPARPLMPAGNQDNQEDEEKKERGGEKPSLAAPLGAPSREEEGLIAPPVAETAAAAIAELVRTLSAERSLPLHRSGPTLEDLVREELRPLLKAWLDTHLPGLVERLVRAEIERVVNRALS
jgi:cell pole-organizing protein PopZ